MKKTKIIVPALAMLLLGTAASVTGTVAWFSVSTAVSVTGMSVNTQVSSNLMIAVDTLDSTTRIADANFGSSISSTLDALLEPVSTTNGKAFFFTTDAKSTGDANADVYTAYNADEIPTSSELDAFDEAYGTTGAVGYKDYVFQLKAVNTQNASKDIKITKLDLIYGGPKDASKAYRVAVFTEDLGEKSSTEQGATVPSGESGTLKGIYSPNGAANFTANSAIGATNSGPTTIATTAYNSVAAVAAVPANKTNYYKVVVRLFLEGEDNTCNNTTFADLTEDWALNLELKIDTNVSNTAVTSIAKYTSAEVSAVMWYYDGTYVWNDIANIGTETGRTAAASASEAVKTAFGIGA